MTPKKRKSSKTSLKEEKKPEISLNLLEEVQTQVADKTGIEDAQEEEKQRKIGVKIKQNIDKVKTKEGIIGYILRNSKSASIDLKDPTKIIDFAVLSSSALEASEKLSNAFELGEVKHILIEGNTVKLLSFSSEENKVSIFMEKNVDHNHIYKDLLG